MNEDWYVRKNVVWECLECAALSPLPLPGAQRYLAQAVNASINMNELGCLSCPFRRMNWGYEPDADWHSLQACIYRLHFRLPHSGPRKTARIWSECILRIVFFRPEARHWCLGRTGKDGSEGRKGPKGADHRAFSFLKENISERDKINEERRRHLYLNIPIHADKLSSSKSTWNHFQQDVTSRTWRRHVT